MSEEAATSLPRMLAEAAQEGINQLSRAHHGPAANGAPVEDEEEPNRVVEHLLLHRSLTDHDPDRLASYVEMARSDVASFRNPFDRAIALTFHLAADQHMDPWSIDLANFSTLYLDRIRDTPEVDLITGGRLLAMAWNVLLRQSEGLLDRAQEDEEPEQGPQDDWDMTWEDMPEAWGHEPDQDETYTEQVLDETNDPPLSESVFRQGDRRVTLFELVDALEEGRRSAERRKRLTEERRKAREQAEAERGEDTVEKEVHEEDLEAEIHNVRERLKTYEDEVDLRRVYNGTRDDYLTVFISTLFLSKAEMVDVRQDDFPISPIYLTPQERLFDDSAALADVPETGPIEETDEDPTDAGDEDEAPGEADASEDEVTEADTEADGQQPSPESGPQVDPAGAVNGGPDPEAEQQAQAQAGTNGHPTPDAEIDGEADAGGDAEAEAGDAPDSTPNAEASSQARADGDVDADPEPDTDAEAGSALDPDADPDPESAEVSTDDAEPIQVN